MAIMNWDSALSALACAAISLWGLLATAAVESISQKNPPNSRSHMRSRRNSNPCRAAARCCSVPNGYSPYQNQLGFRLNSTLFDTKEWPSTLLHGHISASRTVLFFRIITISMFTLSSGPQHIVTLRLPAFFPAAEALRSICWKILPSRSLFIDKRTLRDT